LVVGWCGLWWLVGCGGGWVCVGVWVGGGLGGGGVKHPWVGSGGKLHLILWKNANRPTDQMRRLPSVFSCTRESRRGHVCSIAT